MMSTRRVLNKFALVTVGGLATYGLAQGLQQAKVSLWPETSKDLASLAVRRVEKHDVDHTAAPLSGFEQIDFADSIDQSRVKLSQWRAANSIPGYVIGVSVRGRNVWLAGDGLADIENAVPCTPNTVMRIASISKSITAAMLAKMVQQNKVDLDKPIRAYLTEDQFPDKTWEGEKVDITLRQLVSHLGGIRHYNKPDKAPPELESLHDGEMPEFYLNQHFNSAIEALALFKQDPLVAKPGSKYVYTTFGWTLISAVIESQLEKKKSFNDALRAFLAELGMNSTQIDENDRIVYNRASYYRVKPSNGSLQNTPPVDNSCKVAGGGLLSTVPDLLRFGNAMLYSWKGEDPFGRAGFLHRSTLDQMWTPVETTRKSKTDSTKFGGYGMGWVVVRDERSRAAFTAEPRFATQFSHGGGAVGASSFLLIEPQREIVIAIITNMQNARELSRVVYDITDAFAAKLTITSNATPTSSAQTTNAKTNTDLL